MRPIPQMQVNRQGEWCGAYRPSSRLDQLDHVSASAKRLLIQPRYRDGGNYSFRMKKGEKAIDLTLYVVASEV